MYLIFAFLVSLPQSRPFPRSCPPPSVVVEQRLWKVVHGKVLDHRRLVRHLYTRPLLLGHLGFLAPGNSRPPNKGKYPQGQFSRRDFRKPSLKGLT